MSHQQSHVLVVDPHQDSCEALAAFLREEGPLEVDSATNGEDAWLKIQRSAHYHVVLLDEWLPPTAGASLQSIGIDLMKKLKTYRPELEAILFRAPERPGGLKQALHAGAWRYLGKDCDRYELLTLIEHSAASRKLRQEAWMNARRVEQLEALRRTTLAITPSTEPDALLRRILNHAVTLLQAKGGGLYKYYPERAELEILEDYNRPFAVGRTRKAGQGVAGKLVETRAPFRIVDNYPESPDKVPDWPSDKVFGALLEVLLIWQERILGVLFVGDDLGRKFTNEEAHFLRSFADQASITLINAELAAQEAEKSQRLEKLVRATKDIIGGLGQTTLAARLDLIAKHVADILDAEASSIFLLQPSGAMRLEAAYGHLPETRKVGRAYPIRSGVGQGLISHIAHTRTAFRDYGEELQKHWACDGDAPGQLPSGERCSMLVLHLWRQVGDEKQWLGLIRVENKRGHDKYPHAWLGFTDEDVRILGIFVEAVVESIENVTLISELKTQKDHWARLVASSPNGIVAVDKDGAITEFNDKAVELLGYTKEEILQRPIDTLYYDEGQARVIGQALHRHKGRITKFLTSMRSKKGENIPIYLSATRLYDAQGARIGNVGYFETLDDVKKLDDSPYATGTKKV